ncbi:MAG: hypothetical protein U9O97_05075 [Elusimicrobiota bacterium]|nr:hypothetical protein [Elusimicrobiota bacterium]
MAEGLSSGWLDGAALEQPADERREEESAQGGFPPLRRMGCGQ